MFYVQAHGYLFKAVKKTSPMDTTHFINFSGGVDSTYYLWKWLQEHRSERIAIHHCLLFQSRREVEKQATDAILAYFRKQGWTNFDYVETEFSRKGLSSLLYDIEVVFCMGGLAMKRFRKVHTVIMSRCLEEFNGNHGLKRHFKNKDATLNNFDDPRNRVSVAIQAIQLLSYRKINIISPYQHKPKAEMIKEMPPELFALTWYCRSPVSGKPCGKCFNCRRVKSMLKTEGGGDAYAPKPRRVNSLNRIRMRRVVKK